MQLLILIALATSALAQFQPNFSKIPSCAIGPGMEAFSKTGCGMTDLKCICSKGELIPALREEVSKACSADEIAQATTFALDTCTAVGVPLHI